MWKLSNRCIYGTDKNDRMARTSKMNMIMHGDGHGGVHHWNGFLNVNGIFENRFDIILTNPPFGSKLERDENVLANDISMPETLEEHYESVYGDPYRVSRNALKAAIDKPIASLFKLPRGQGSSIKTEVLFIERCLDLLKPGGRLGIVLPEGIFNNPSVLQVRHFVEDRARILAVVSLPGNTFVASGATVKTSLLFLQKFTVEQQKQYDLQAKHSLQQAQQERKAEVEKQEAILKTRNTTTTSFLKKVATHTKDEVAKAAEAAAAANATLKSEKAQATKRIKQIEAEIIVKARALLRSAENYLIFMYEAEKVGLTATGAADENELVPNGAMPKTLSKSALEIYKEFRKAPEAYLSSQATATA